MAKTYQDPMIGVPEDKKSGIWEQMQLLFGVNQQEVYRVDQMSAKDRSEKEANIYKRFRYETWVARGKTKAGSDGTAKTKTVPVKRTSDQKMKDDFSGKPERPVRQDADLPVRKKKVDLRRYCIPSHEDMDKQFMDRRQILFSIRGVVHIADLMVVSGDRVVAKIRPDYEGETSDVIELTWDQAWMAVYKGAILQQARPLVVDEVQEEKELEEVKSDFDDYGKPADDSWEEES